MKTDAMRIDRLTFGIEQRSADHVVPELQQLVVGDRVPDSDDFSTFFTVEEIHAPNALVLHSTRHVMKPLRTIDFSWAFVIRGVASGQSRLFIRARANYAPRGAAPFVEWVIGPADFVNAGAMLRGIKRRVEAGNVELDDFTMVRKLLLGGRHRAETRRSRAEASDQGEAAVRPPLGGGA